MNLEQIRKKVAVESDARFGETIDRLLTIMRNRHTHKCHEKECWCEYCKFIRGEYVTEKMVLHTLKVRLRNITTDSMQSYHFTDYYIHDATYIETKIGAQMQKVAELKAYKKDLQTNII